MHSNGQGFFNNHPTTGTFLGCSIGRHLSIPSPGASSLGFEYREENAPRCIGNSFSKIFIFNHVFDFQIFHSKAIVISNKRIRNFMIKIKSLISNLFMTLSEKNASLFSVNGTRYFAGKLFMIFNKMSFCCFKIFSRKYSLAITGGNNCIQTKINSNFFTGFRKYRCLIFNIKTNIPFPVPSSNRKSFDITFNRSMPFNFYAAYILKIKTTIFYLTTIANNCIKYCIKSIGGFESRIAGFFSCLNTRIEILERFIKASKGLIQRGVIAKSKYFIFFFQSRQKISRLSKKANPLTCSMIYFPSLLKGFIVKKTMSGKLGFKRNGLFGFWVKAVFIRFEHYFTFRSLSQYGDLHLGQIRISSCFGAQEWEHRLQ